VINKRLVTAERGALLYKLADLVEKNLNVLATLDTWDMGKPLSVTKSEDLVETINTLRCEPSIKLRYRVGC